MKKSVLIKRLEETTGYDEKVVERIINAFTKEITDLLKKGESVSIHGFGKFSPRKYGERKCYNPITKELITLQPSVQPAFTAGPKLRQQLNCK